MPAVKKWSRFLCLIIIIFSVFYFSPFAEAAKFNKAVVQLEKTSGNTPTGGTVCAETGSSGSESSVSVTFPPGFTLNGNSANWTTGTLNLPAGSVPWPGINTATNVSAQTVTFPGADLIQNTFYCFNFSGTNTLTTGSAGNDQNGQISTGIDTSIFALSIGTQNLVNVSARVRPTNNSYDLTITNTNPLGQEIYQDTVIDIEVTYESNTAQPYDVVLQSGWDLGRIDGNDTPSVEVVNYFPDSASNAFGNAAPVIDPINKAISWHIGNFSAADGVQTVTYQLKTTSLYRGDKKVFFNPYTRVLVDSAPVGTDVIRALAYIYRDPYREPGSDLTPPSQIAAPKEVNPTKQNQSGEPSILQNVEINNLGFSGASINAITSKNAKVTLEYGLGAKKLDKKLISLEENKEHTFVLEPLTPETVYFFRLLFEAENGRKSTSDLYTFKTSKVSEMPKIDPDSVILTSGNNILLNSADIKQGTTVVIPTNTAYQINFGVQNPNSPLKDVQIETKNTQVLGLSTEEKNLANLSSQKTRMVPLSPGRYTGILKSDTTPGEYSLSSNITDFSGNVATSKLITLRVVTPFAILEKGSSKPVERASVKLQIYNSNLKVYEPLTSQNLPFSNIVFSDINGRIFVALNHGKYRAQIKAPGYHTREIEFEIDPQTTLNYPIFYLEREPFNMISMIGYYKDIILDSLQTTYLDIKSLAASSWIFNLGGFLTLFLLALITYLSFFHKTHFRMRHLWFELRRIILRKDNDGPICETIRGFVSDKHTKKPIAPAEIIVIDSSSERVVYKTKTNKDGIFIVDGKDLKGDLDYKLLIIKEGFIPFESSLETKSGFNSCKLMSYEPLTEKVKYDFTEILEGLFNLSFEMLLVLSLILELIFSAVFGLYKVLPFLLITFINIVMWAVYLHQSLFIRRKLLSE